MAIPFFLYKIGGPVAAAGIDGCFYQANFAQPDFIQPCPTPPRRGVGHTTGGGRRRHRERTLWEKTLTRKNFAEIAELLAAEAKAVETADALENSDASEALLNAADVAREVAENVNRPEAQRLARLLHRAASAHKTEDIIARAEIARRYARVLIDRAQDEEDIIALLLLPQMISDDLAVGVQSEIEQEEDAIALLLLN